MNSLGMFHSASVGARAAATIMFLIGVMFGIAAAFNMIILLKVTSDFTLSALFAVCSLIAKLLSLHQFSQ